MWRKKLSYEKLWSGFNKFFAEEYQDLRKLKRINANQVRFHGENMAITIQDNITKALDNLAMSTTTKQDVLTQLTSTIK